jgi:hypothetical protein
VAQADPNEPLDAAAAGAGAGASGHDGDDFLAEDEDPDYAFDDAFDEDGEGEPVETIDEQGRRHIRRAAPEGTDQILENEAPRHSGLSDKAERWRMRSATGTVLTAFAFGLKEVFEPNRNQPAIIMETSGDPPKDLPVEAELEQLGPRRSTVMVRSWLLGNNLPGKGSPGEAGTNGEDGPATAPTAQGDEETTQ